MVWDWGRWRAGRWEGGKVGRYAGLGVVGMVLGDRIAEGLRGGGVGKVEGGLGEGVDVF